MSKYTGFECIACGEKFTDDDDVVVCPECGTPYHRECYVKNGKCINEELHKSGESWECSSSGNSSENIETDEKSNTRCPRCGFENTPDKLFCEKCGMPLITPDNPVPFNDGSQNNGQQDMQDNFANPGFEGTPFEGQAVYNQDSVVGGIRLGDYARYIGSNSLSFLAKFIKFDKFGGKLSLNLCAFLFPHLYFFYRKMNKWGVLFMVIYSLLMIPAMVVLFSAGYAGVKMNFAFDVGSKLITGLASLSIDLRFGIQVLAGIFANYIYYKKANKDIKSVYTALGTEDPDTTKDTIINKGGISWIGVIVGFTASMVISCLGLFALTLIK